MNTKLQRRASGGRGGAPDPQRVLRTLALCSLVAVYGLLAPASAPAQNNTREMGAESFRTTPVATNQWLVSTQDLKFFAVLAQNSSASDIWLLGFNRRTNGIPNGSVSDIAPVRVVAATTGGWDFGISGFPCKTGLVVCVSTTDRALTNGSAVAQMTVTYRRP